MDLSSLQPAPGSRRGRRRGGRGPGPGLGKTAGRGHKGQRSRAGGGSKPGYEGGQMPLHRRLPTRGFHNPFRREFHPVNLGRLARFPEGSTVDPAALVAAGLASDGQLIKILGFGDLPHRLVVRAHGFSASARSAIEAHGGQAEVMA